MHNCFQQGKAVNCIAMQHTDEKHVPRRGYSIKAAAKALSLCERTLRGLIAEGRIHAPFVSTKRRAVPDTEIQRIFEEGIG